MNPRRENPFLSPGLSRPVPNPEILAKTPWRDLYGFLAYHSQAEKPLMRLPHQLPKPKERIR